MLLIVITDQIVWHRPFSLSEKLLYQDQSSTFSNKCILLAIGQEQIKRIKITDTDNRLNAEYRPRAVALM